MRRLVQSNRDRSEALARDPLSWATSPPKGETSNEREQRVRREDHARQTSLRIDEEIKTERMKANKKRPLVKLLFLGQSESGKSTAIKNFQLKYNPQAWVKERASWRIVIYLNLVRSVNKILDVLAEEMSVTTTPSHSPTRATFLPSFARGNVTSTPNNSFPFTGEHKVLKLRLGPLRHIQTDLESLLGSSSLEAEDSCTTHAALSTIPTWDGETGFSQMNEFFVRSNHGWKTAMVNYTTPSHHVDRRTGKHAMSPQCRTVARSQYKQAEDVTDVIVSCAPDIKALWVDDLVRTVLTKHDLRLDDSSGFFLDDVDRIAARNYEPSDDDVMRARLRTIGVQEYRFLLGKDSNTGGEEQEWVMYDVAGVRTSRATWLSFFDDVNAVIFLAPISSFDESLSEDSTVNRLGDSFALWNFICSSKVLMNVELILFLNKCDLLKKKLNKGNVRMKDYVRRYDGEGNDFKTVTKWFFNEFRRIQRKHCPKRPFYPHFTCVVDPSATAATIISVKSAILERHLKAAGMM